MTDETLLMEAFDGRVRRRNERRDFFKTMIGGAAMGAGMLALGSAAEAQTTAPSDFDILNFALNLEYLEAQFYSFASTGAGLPDASLNGTVGTRGAATGGRKAALSDPSVIQYAREITQDEVAHVLALRAAIGSTAVAQPAIDISPAVFTAVAVGAGVDLTPFGGIFDPYASDDAFLLGAYLFEDVGVTAYKGGAPLLASADIVDAAAGILAAEAFHAGIIRGALYRRGLATPVLRTTANTISDGRDTLDGTTNSAGPPMRVADDDQGISPTTVGGLAVSNIFPTDANGIAFSRTTEQVHNIVYNTRNAATSGGFFPNGTNNANAALRRSGAN